MRAGRGKKMNKVSKGIIMLEWKQEIVIIDAYLSTLRRLKKFAEKWDGKVINKRFIDGFIKVNGVDNVCLYMYHGNRNLIELRTSYKLLFVTTPGYNWEIKRHTGYILRVSKHSDSEQDHYLDSSRRLSYDVLAGVIDYYTTMFIEEKKKINHAIKNFDKIFEKVMKVNVKLRKLKAELQDTPFEIDTNHVEFSQFTYDYWSY